MSSASIAKTKDMFEKRMKDILSKTDGSKGGFARVYAVYQRLQTERFQTENASEGQSWQPLNPIYAQYKRKRYGGGLKRSGGNWNSYPGAGSKMLIGTGMLAGAAIGPGAPFSGVGNHRAMFTERQMTIAVDSSGKNPDGQDFGYAGFVSEKRPFMKFSENSISEMRTELSRFILGI